MNWENIKNNIIEFCKTGGVSILKALAVLIIGILLVKLVLSIMKKAFAKTKIEKIAVSFIMSISKFCLYLIVILLVCQQLGISTTGFVAIVTASTLAIGLSLQNSLSNLANGIIIITTKPFHEGDYVNIGGVEGSVKNIHMFTTAITTVDGKLVIIPNSSIVTNNVINYNILGRRRVEFTFDVAYESDINKVNEIILTVMKSNGKVYLDPEPFVSLKTLDASSLKFFAYCFVDSEDYWSVYYYVMNTVFNEFKKNNISIPFNQMEVRLREDKVKMPYETNAVIERVEKVRKEDTKKDFISEIMDLGKKVKLKTKKSKTDKTSKTNKTDKK